MRRQRVQHPKLRAAAVLQGSLGRGGPVPIDPQKQKPIRPPVQVPTFDPLGALASSFGTLATEAEAGLLGSGQIVLGVALIVAGLLLATGSATGTGRAGLRFISRGHIG